jgi:SAM-dependent methyltransferase
MACPRAYDDGRLTAVDESEGAPTGAAPAGDDYLTVNKASWDERAPAHAASGDYAFARFVEDPAFLSDVVRFDLPRLGDVSGARGVHLQCHIGTDTLSLARLGAQMTGLDFSSSALDQARRLSAAAGPHVDFVESDVYSSLDVLDASAYDLVFTGIGALCWLPDIRRWAAVVGALLAPGGRLFIREGHPMLWAIGDPRDDGLLAVEHSYFERPEPTVWTEGGTYVETDVEFEHNTTHEWNHGLGELVTALIDEGLRLTMLEEHDSVPWDPLPGMTVGAGSGEHRLRDRPWRLAASYTLQAVRP